MTDVSHFYFGLFQKYYNSKLKTNSISIRVNEIVVCLKINVINEVAARLNLISGNQSQQGVLAHGMLA